MIRRKCQILILFIFWLFCWKFPSVNNHSEAKRDFDNFTSIAHKTSTLIETNFSQKPIQDIEKFQCYKKILCKKSIFRYSKVNSTLYRNFALSYDELIKQSSRKEKLNKRGNVFSDVDIPLLKPDNKQSKTLSAFLGHDFKEVGFNNIFFLAEKESTNYDSYLFILLKSNDPPVQRI